MLEDPHLIEQHPQFDRERIPDVPGALQCDLRDDRKTSPGPTAVEDRPAETSIAGEGSVGRSVAGSEFILNTVLSAGTSSWTIRLVNPMRGCFGWN